MKKCYTYDDVQIVPGYSDIEHRKQCNTITRVTKNVHLEIPLVSSPMDTVTGFHMAVEMDKLGGMGFLHRFKSPEDTAYDIEMFRHQRPMGTIGASIGVTGDYLKIAQMYVDNGAQIILLDVAHGHHSLVKEAIGRLNELESLGIEDTRIIEYNNGIITTYVKEPEPPVIDPNEEVVALDTNEVKVVPDVKEKQLEGFYRVQIIAHKRPLDNAVFEGIDNVMPFPGDDGWIRYMTGTFPEYLDAVNHMREMRARGFEDAFIVTFRNGERINLNIAIKKDDNMSKNNTPPIEEEKTIDIDFTVQILIAPSSDDIQNLKKMKKLGKINKEILGSGAMIKYTIGTYNNLEDAEDRLQEARKAGFADAFIFSVMQGERISLTKAQTLLDN